MTQFIEKARIITPDISDITDQELRLQYRDFLNKIENNLSDDAEDTKLKSMDILKMFLSPELKLYENVETIVHILCTAATTMSVESVVESWVSVYENHSNKHRPITNERAEREVAVAVNGPLVQHADSLIKEALKDMFKDAKDVKNRNGHFVRRTQNIADYSVSKSVDSIVKKSKLRPFMC